ncbi:MAG TPA: AbrB/MazE/SpoVT family DNA-binding domain-containing protein [Candidatus Acidoferrum sp.]|nr:AbrB/MazE/SpoVT family DNA-binding domain-containing protein [Candidatus Acidoferrum sp.]
MKRVKPSRRQGFTRLSSKRQVTLPLRVVEQLKLKPGNELKVDAEGGRVVLARPDSLATRRRTAVAEVAGGLPGVWEPGDLERLRDEWR